MLNTATAYTHHYAVPSSSVVDALYYDEDSETLYVVTIAEDAYGYEGVTLAQYENFTNQLTAGSSAGRLWNDFIKPGFTSTGWVDPELLEPRDEEEDDGALDYNEDRYQELVAQATVQGQFTPEEQWHLDRIRNAGDYVVQDKQPATEVPVESNVFAGHRNRYIVEYIESDGTVDAISVYAAGEYDALVRFGKIADQAGWPKVKITSLTRNFN